MKTSTVLLGVWALVLASVALVVVYFLRSGDTYGGGPGTVIRDPAGQQPAAGTPDKPTKPPRANTGRGTRQPQEPLAIAGRVIDAEGRGIEGASVRVFHPARQAPPPAAGRNMDEVRRVCHLAGTIAEDDWEVATPLSTWSDAPPVDPNRPTGPEIVSGTSDADGRFKLDLPQGVGRGPFRVSARVERIGSASASDVHAGRDVELTLATGGLVTGSVVSRQGAVPVEGAKVVFDSGEREWVAATDASGQFRIEGMPPGRYSARVGSKGRTPILGQAVKVERGTPVRLELPVGTTLRVKTVQGDSEEDVENAPTIGGVEVVAMEEESRVYVVGRSNDYGMVEFAGLPAGSWIINGRVEKWISLGELIVPLDENKQFADEILEFETAVTTPVVVVDERGTPVAGVEFFTGDGYESYDVLRSERLPGKTDAQGNWSFAFEFDGPRCLVFAFRQGYGVAQIYPEDYSSGDAQRIVLRKAVRFHGRVTDAAGQPVADALVRFTFDPVAEEPPPGRADPSVSDTLYAQVRTGAAGTYDFPFAPEGWITIVEAEHGDAYCDEAPEIEPEEGKTDYQVDLQLSEAETPEVRIGGNPVAPPPPHPVPPGRK